MGNAVSVLDEVLLRAAAGGKSAEEMQVLSGIPAPQALQRVKQLLASRDVWTEFEQRQLLLAELHELKDSLKTQAIQAQDPEAGRLLLKTLETIGKRLDAQKQNIDENMLKLSEFQQGVLIRAMDAALDYAKKELLQQHPEIKRSELDTLVAEGLQLAKIEIMEEDAKRPS